jgi:hypothetical protein
LSQIRCTSGSAGTPGAGGHPGLDRVHRATSLDIATSGGIVISRHRLAAPGAGATVRDTGHVAALERAALTAFTNTAPTSASNASHPGPPPAPVHLDTAGGPVTAEG